MAMDTLVQDLRYALRLLLKSPGFAVVAIITLALGIGATTAMFTVVNSVILKPFPFAEPDQLVMVKERIQKLTDKPLSIPAPDVLTFQRETKSFTTVAGYQEDTLDLTGDGIEPRNITATRVTWNLLPVLGVSPMIGRNFTPEEDRENSAKVTILSYKLWRTLFSGDPAALGKTVTLNRTPYTVIGVMPPSFLFPIETYKEDSVLWVPMAFKASEVKSVGDNFDYSAIARLKPGVPIQQAQADVERVVTSIIHEGYPADLKADFDTHGVVVTLRDSALGTYRQPLVIMMVAVVLVLLISIANVANLLLAKGSSRQRELSIRIALGAGARRLFGQLISESVLLGFVGGFFGIILAQFGTDALVSLVPANIPRLHTTEIDWRVLGFTILISLVSGIVFGAAPALFALRMNVNDGLKEGGRGGMQGRQHRYARTAFVIAQFSLALMLLIGAGLLIRSFQHMLQVDPGFRADHVISGGISLPRTAYKEPAQRMAFYKELMRRLSETAGIQSAGGSTDLPLESGWTKIISIEGQVPPPGAALNIDSHSVILGDYLQTMGIPLIRGRLFNDSDNAQSTRVVIISKALADQFFRGQDPVGHRLKWGPPASTEKWLTIIGVVGDVKQSTLDTDTRPHTYESYHQYESGIGSLNIAARTHGDPTAAGSTIQSVVHTLDPQLPVTDIRTMERVLTESTSARRFYLVLVMVFAATAIVLASVGLYGVVAFAVEQRTREIGIRMTLGATQNNVLQMLLRWALMLVGGGIVSGAIGAFVVTRMLTSFLFGTRPDDPLTFVSVSLLLAAVALLASYIPARRATKVDPMVALRYE
jgi:predicted permease